MEAKVQFEIGFKKENKAIWNEHHRPSVRDRYRMGRGSSDCRSSERGRGCYYRKYQRFFQGFL